MSSKPSVTILNCSDYSGCSTWRMLFPSWAVRTQFKQIATIDTMMYIFDEKMYDDINAIMLRPGELVSQSEIVERFLCPLREKNLFWIFYSLDDINVYKDIPDWNIGKEAYSGDDRYEALKKILQLVDFVIVTTDELKDYYVNEYSLDADKFLVIPNYMPNWWVGNCFDIEKQMELFKKQQKHPRVGIISSSSHYDIDNKNNGIDDITHIEDYIRSSTKEYEWVFVGAIPNSLKDLVNKKEIKYLKSFDILNYPNQLSRLELTSIVAPLQDNIFNRCKSNIKILEASALGIPFLAQDLPNYSKYTSNVFSTANDLDSKLRNLYSNGSIYKSHIRKNRTMIDGNEQYPKGWFLENNLEVWHRIFSMPKRTMELALNKKPQENTNVIGVE